MLRVLSLVCLAVSCLAAPYLFDAELDAHWQTFKTKYAKSYGSEQELMRRAIWESNLKIIRDHNIEADMGMHTYTLGVNEYIDMTSEEFRKQMNSYRMSNATGMDHRSLFVPLNNIALPDEVDWVDEGYVTPVKNQGNCGSCWAFSTTGALEGQNFRATGNLVSLSEQNLVDCSTAQGDSGCNGGLMDFGFEYVIENGGIDTEESYPYLAVDGRCQYDASTSGCTCSGFTDVTSGSESALQEAVGTVGPVAVAIDASQSSFQMYKSGVYNEPRCSSRALDHGVLAVGYGTEDGKDYWLVKNSWGTTWGLEGYIKMTRNDNNQCGIATSASYPQVP